MSTHLGRRCERQVGFVMRHSALFGSYPKPIYCAHNALDDSMFCQQHQKQLTIGEMVNYGDTTRQP